MDKTVVTELSAMLVALRSAGETGFWILAVFLLVVIALAAVAVVYQRIVISRFQVTSKATEETFNSVNTQIKAVDTQLKTIDTSLKERELGVKERDELRNIFSQQFSIVKDTNAELRTEMTRLREQQTGLNDSINATITAGLQDIRDRLTQTSVKEIIAQIPERFRKDFEAEFGASLHAAVISLINEELQERNIVYEYFRDTSEKFCEEFKDMVPAYIREFRDFGPRFFVKFFIDMMYDSVLEETGDRDFAARVALGVVHKVPPWILRDLLFRVFEEERRRGQDFDSGVAVRVVERFEERCRHYIDPPRDWRR